MGWEHDNKYSLHTLNVIFNQSTVGSWHEDSSNWSTTLLTGKKARITVPLGPPDIYVFGNQWTWKFSSLNKFNFTSHVETLFLHFTKNLAKKPNTKWLVTNKNLWHEIKRKKKKKKESKYIIPHALSEAVVIHWYIYMQYTIIVVSLI